MQRFSFAQAANAGIVFKGKKKKNARGVWEDAEETIDAWPEVLFIKPGSWAADDGFIKPGATLTSINGAAAPATFALAKDMLKAASEACSASNPFVELVWRAGAEEVPPSEEISMPVRQRSHTGFELPGAPSAIRVAVMPTKATIDGSDPIEVCVTPTEPLFVEGAVLENPKQVKADLKDDLGAYNARMLVNMSEFFQAQVESKSPGTVSVSPDGDSCTY